jgi:hypothetical protein
LSRSKWTTAEPFDTLFERLLLNRKAFVHILDFAFGGIGWSNPSSWDCELYLNVPTALLGRSPGTRPGDIDVLVVPCSGRTRYWDSMIAVEVKSFRVRSARRGKSPSDFGSEQVRGLVDIGFPYAGLLHLAVMERGTPDEHEMLPVYPTDTWGAANAPPTKWINLDLSSSSYAFRHNPRLQGLSLPDCVGLKLFSTVEMPNGGLHGHTIGYERAVSENPNKSDELIAGISSILAKFPSRRVGFSRPRFRSTALREVGAHNGVGL